MSPRLDRKRALGKVPEALKTFLEEAASVKREPSHSVILLNTDPGSQIRGGSFSVVVSPGI